MPHFQGSGFSVELPDDCADASAYTFILPTPKDAQFAPFVVIKAEALAADTLESHVRAQHMELQQNLENCRILTFKAGQHAGTDVVLTTLEWGPPAARISQTQAYYLVAGEKNEKVFGLKGTDLSENFGNSQPAFNGIFRTFMPNNEQLLAEVS